MKFKKLHLMAIVLMASFGLLVGCGGSDNNQATAQKQQQLSGEIKIAGSSTVYPVSTALAEEFQKMHPDVRISVSSTGTGGGFGNFFCPGKTDINDASRPVKDSEMNQCQKNGVNPIEFQIGIDALTVVANNEADWASCMTTDQLKQIWGPDNPPQKWNDVNSEWPNEEFELYGAASTSGTFDYFTEAIMHEGGAHRSDYQKTEHDNIIVQGVAGSKYALGYFGFAYYSQNKDKLQAVAVDSGDGCVKPTLKNARTGKYQPLSRPLFIYASKEAMQRPVVKEFMEFYIKKSASDLVSQVGYVPVPKDVMQENMAKLERVTS